MVTRGGTDFVHNREQLIPHNIIQCVNVKAFKSYVYVRVNVVPEILLLVNK